MHARNGFVQVTDDIGGAAGSFLLSSSFGIFQPGSTPSTLDSSRVVRPAKLHGVAGPDLATKHGLFRLTIIKEFQMPPEHCRVVYTET